MIEGKTVRISIAMPSVRVLAARSQGRSRRFGVRLAVVALAAAAGLSAGAVVGAPAAVADTAPPSGTPVTVSADPLPTTQIDGVAWTQAVRGNTVYVGGQFANARPAGAAPGTNLSARTNLLAYTLSTGALVTSWSPAANAPVLSMATSPDGSRLYVAGQFTTVAGQTRNRVAAFDTASGALVGNWAPNVNAKVNSVVATNSTVYLGGEFSSVNGVARTRVAAVSAANGSTLAFNATLDGGYGVRSVVVSPDGTKVVIGGSFTSTNGSTNPGRGMAALNATTGASLPWAVNSLIRDAGTNAAMYSLASDGDSVYGTGYDYYGTAEDGFEGSFRANWSDGSLVWMEDCHGDSYSVFPAGDAVYVTGHSHYCGNIGGFPQTSPNWQFHHSIAFAKAPSGNKVTADPLGYKSYAGQPAGTLLNWFPTWVEGTYTGQSQAGWDVKASGDYVLYGGEFPAVDGVNQQGLVRFAKPNIAPNKFGPQTQGGSWALNAKSVRAGEVRLGWNANYDLDNTKLHYDVYRSDKGTTTPLWSTDLSSTFWNTPAMSYVDPTAVAGQTYSYRIKATDPFGNWTWTDWTPVTVSSTSASPYVNAVLGDGAQSFWRLGEASGSAVSDWAGVNNAVLAGGYTRGQTGAITGDADKATAFGGTNGVAVAQQNLPGSNSFTIEAWVKTSSTAGGKIVGFGDKPSGNSSNYDRHIYLDASGFAYFGVYNGNTVTIKSPTPINDNAWHQVVGSLDAGGMTFYVDGKRVGRNAAVTTGQSYTGYWRIGGDSTWSGNRYLNGTIDDVSLYGSALSFSQVLGHYTSSGRTVTKPADAYGSAVFTSGPDLYWRLGESAGPTAADTTGNGATGTYSGGVTFGVTGAVTGTTDKAVTTNGTTGLVSSVTKVTRPPAFSEELWFKTTTTSGGKLVGLGSSATGLSTTVDSQVVMLNTGQLRFTAGAGVITSTKTYNDGAFHHVVGTQGPSGTVLYVDGVSVGNSATTTGSAFSGNWRVGGDRTGDAASSSNYFAGTLDEVAIYSTVLSAADVSSHFTAGGGATPVTPPTASFSSTVANLSVSFNGSASTTPNGSITGYAWDFGDGTTGTGATPNHTYASAKAYQVTLTVTDSANATGTTTKTVTTTAPPVTPPTAAFSSTVANLAVSFDASGSTTPNGSITSYAWDFGDGMTGTGVSPSHTYTAAQAYQVKLTVTDSANGTASVTKTVTTTAPTALATDSFNDRTVTGSWGTAQTGGDWQLYYGSGSFSVAGGNGQIALNQNDTRMALLPDVSANGADVTASFTVDRTGAGFYTSVVGRSAGGSSYTARSLLEDGGTIRLYVLRDESSLTDSFVLPGVTYAAGDRVNLRILVNGTSPTTVSAMAWTAAQPKPTAWQITATDSTAALQTAGSVGVVGRLAGWATTPTATISLDSFVATRPTP